MNTIERWRDVVEVARKTEGESESYGDSLRCGVVDLYDALVAAEGRCANVEVQLVIAELRLGTAKKLIRWLHSICCVDGCGLDGGDVQDKMLGLGISECRPAPPGSPDANEWGEGTPLYFLRPEWAGRGAVENMKNNPGSVAENKGEV